MDQDALIQDSFNQLEPLLDIAATLFYTRLFELEPALRQRVSGDLRAHAQRSAQLLRLAVGQLAAPAELRRTLADAAAHAIAPATWASACAALLWTLHQSLGPEFTPDAEAAWAAAFGRLQELAEALTLDPAPACGSGEIVILKEEIL